MGSFDIVVNALDNASKVLDSVGSKGVDIGQKVESAGTKANGALSKIGSAGGKAASALGGVAKIAGGFVIGQALFSAPGALLNMAKGAADDAASMARLQQAVSNADGSFGQYEQAVNNAISTGQGLAFSDDDIRNGLTNLTNSTGSTEEALSRLSLAQDLARGTGMDLGTASKLLGKVTDESTGVLKRYGITLGENATAQDLMNEVDKRFGGQAASFAESDAGKLARVTDRWGELQETIGAKVLPILAAVTGFALDKVFPMLEGMTSQLDGPLHAAWDTIAGVVQRVIPAFQAVASIVGGALQSAWTTARDAVLTFAQALQGNWTHSDKIAPLHQAIGRLGDIVRSVVIPVWNTLRSVLAAVAPHFDTIKRAVSALSTILGGPTLAMLKGIIAGFGAQGLSGIIPGAIEGLKKFGSAFLTLGSIILNALKSVDWGKLAGDIASGLATGLSAVADFGSRFLSFVTDKLGSVDWGGVGSTIIDGIVAGIEAVADFAGRFLGFVSGQLTSVDWSGIGSTIINGIISGIEAVADFAGRFLAWASGQLTSIDWSGIGQTIIDGIIAGVEAVAGFGERFLAWASGQLSAVDWTGIGTTLVNGIMTGVEAVADFGARVGTWIQTAFSGVDWSGVAQALLDGLTTAATALDWSALGSTIAGALSGAGIDLGPLLEQLGSLMAALQPVVDIVSGALVSAWNSLKLAFDQVIVAITGATPVLEQLRALWASLQPAIDLIVPALKIVGTIIGAIVVVAVIALAKALEALAPILGAVLVAAVNVAIGIITSLIASLTLFINVVTGVVKIVAALIQGDWGAAWAAAKQLVLDAIDGIVGIWSGLPSVIAGFAASLVSDVLAKFDELWHEAVSKISSMATEVQSGVEGMVHSVVGFFGDLVTDAVGKANELWTSLVTTFGNIYTTVTTKISETVNEAVRLVGELPGRAASAVGDLSTALFQAGADLVQGFINGIKSLAEAAASAAGDIAKNAVGAVLGFGHSPWPDLIDAGKDFVEGFVLGIVGKKPEAVSAAVDLAMKVIDAFNALLELGARILHEGVTIPAEEIVTQFKFAIEHIVTSIVDTAALFAKKGLEGAQRFAEAAGPILDLLVSGVEGFAALATYADPGNDKITAFKFAIEHLITSISDTAATFTEKGLEAAKRFADAAGPIIALIVGALEAFAALQSGDADWSIEDIAFRFAKKIELLVQAIEATATQFKARGLEAAKRFADAAGPIVALVGAALEAFALLQSDDSDWSIEDIAYRFAKKIELLVQAVEATAKQFKARGLRAAKRFAETAGPIVAIVQTALEAFNLLKKNDGDWSIEDIAFRFGKKIELLVQAIVAGAQTFKAKGLAAARDFAETGKVILDLLTAATDFEGLPDFGKNFDTNISKFLANVELAITKLVELGKKLGKGLKDAQKIAKAIAQIIDLLTSSQAGTGGSGGSGGNGYTPENPNGGAGGKNGADPEKTLYEKLHNIQGGDPTRYTGAKRASPTTYNIYGMQPGDVQREIERAERRLAMNWRTR